MTFGTHFILNKINSSSLLELVPEEEINKIDRIVIDRHADNAYISITDKRIINKILDDFYKMELKKVNNPITGTETYAIRPYPKETFGG